MGFGVARPAQAAWRAAVFGCGLIACLSGPAFAQDAPGPIQLSPSCDAPMKDVASPGPLPNLEADIEARRTIRVLAIGSSSTVGLGASNPNLNYPAQFEAIMEKAFKGLDVVTINRGVSGEVASATATRLRTLVALEKPDLVLWQVGTNDAMARVPAEDFGNTVRGTLRWLKEHGIDVALVGLQYTLKASTDPHYVAIRTALRAVAESENVLFVRRYEAMEFLERIKHANLISPDELHLNDLGYRCMAEHIARAVVASAFIKGHAQKKAAR